GGLGAHGLADTEQCELIVLLRAAHLACQLRGGAAQSLHSGLVIWVRHLEQDAAWLDVGDPLLDRALTGTHTHAEWLLGQWTVRDDVDPHLATTLTVAVGGSTCSLDPAVRDVGRLQGLQAVVAEGHTVAALGHTATVRAVLAAELNALGDKHLFLALLLLLGALAACTTAARALTATTAGRALVAS